MSAAPDLDAIYAQRFAEDDAGRLEWRRAVWRALVEDFFSRWIPPTAAVLDYGCGLGEFLGAVRSRRRIGADTRASLRQRLPPGVEFVHAQGLELPDLPSRSLDVIFCSNLLEHLPDRASVLALFREFRRVLAPDGRLLVLGPNLQYTGAAYWDFFDHVLPLTHRSLAEALAAEGFAIETLLPRFLPYTTVGARQTPPALVRIYLRVPLLWRLLGAQFFAVATPRTPVPRPAPI